MEKLGRTTVLVVLLLSLLLGFSTAAAFVHTSEVVTTSRHLLQQETTCTADFEGANYTGIISKCKGPKYPVTSCCPPFKEFICLYRDYINDLSSDCTEVMFTYLNNQGGYPAGLFSNMCRDAKEGYDCTGFPNINNSTTAATTPATTTSIANSVSSFVYLFSMINLVGIALAFTFF